VPAKIFPFAANDSFQPCPDFGAVHIVIVNPAFVAGIIGRVDIDALHLTAIIGEQRLERLQIIAFDQQIARVRIPRRKRAVAVQQPRRYFPVMIDDGGFADPVQRWHEFPLLRYDMDR
jgi:hypothetical protein